MKPTKSSSSTSKVIRYDQENTWTVYASGKSLIVAYNTRTGSLVRMIPKNETSTRVKFAIENDKFDDLLKDAGLDFMMDKPIFAKVSILCDWAAR